MAKRLGGSCPNCGSLYHGDCAQDDERDWILDPPPPVDPVTVVDGKRLLAQALAGTLPPWPYGLTPKDISPSPSTKEENHVSHP